MIEARALSFTYPGAATPTLNDLNLSVASGEVYGLLGPSGAGKSTAQRILMGLQQGYFGSVHILGRPIAELGRGLYERIGVSFELPALYLRLTALENLRLFAALYSRPVRDPMDVLAEVDLADAANQRVQQFSKGMKMRLNMARAMLHDPDILFLDEPTTGQDPTRARTTRALIRSLKARGKTVFLTTHNMSEAAEICDRVGFLAEGTISVTGSPRDLERAYGMRQLRATVSTEAGLRDVVWPMDGIGHNTTFLDHLKRDEVVSLHTMEASLDDVFIRATGAVRPE